MKCIWVARPFFVPLRTAMELKVIKQRFDIVGNAPELDRALDIARQVAPTDLSVLITGESGVGKEVFSQIIHQCSARKHGSYIAVNCGAIPEGTIDSELFGHEKGSFTGAHDARKGYFEVANGGTIFLDEVAELPLTTQVRLLRVLESGEFLKVGSSKVEKTNVRVVAATNVNVLQYVQSGRFREDLFYRLNTVPIHVIPLRERKGDIGLLFRKFASDFADRYRMPIIVLSDEAVHLLINYYWPGNIRQLKNVAEQLSVIESAREISAEILARYLPQQNIPQLPVLYHGDFSGDSSFSSERDILYKILFDMRNDVNDMKKVVNDLKQGQSQTISTSVLHAADTGLPVSSLKHIADDTEELQEETLSLQGKEEEMIKKALQKYHGKRKLAADELGISERTLYRKIKEYNLD